MLKRGACIEESTGQGVSRFRGETTDESGIRIHFENPLPVVTSANIECPLPPHPTTFCPFQIAACGILCTIHACYPSIFNVFNAICYHIDTHNAPFLFPS